MWVRIPDEIAEKFLGSNPFLHHDGEERLKIRLREALKDRGSDDVRRLEGRCLHEKFIRCLGEAGVLGSAGTLDADVMWGSLRGDEMEGWHLLAEEIATGIAANGRELSRYELKVNEALERFYADGKLEGVDIAAVQRILERE